MGHCKSLKKLQGKTMVITGANSGIGLETAVDLAARGARVILACRNKQRGMAAVEKVKKETGNQNVELKELDLSSFVSVKKFAQDVNTTLGKVDILVNNG